MVAAFIGAVIGAIAAQKVEMTSMPEMVALFNGSGGIASLMVGWAALYNMGNTTFTDITILLSIVIGGMTFSGSILAWGKLSEVMTSAAVVFGAQRIVNAGILVGLIACSVLFCMDPSVDSPYLYAVIALSLLFGVMAVLPIGGADMPVVISLLNSYSGLAACAAGFAINNNILIVAGSMVGAAGIILTNIMCKAMNRSLGHVLFSGFGAVKQATKVEGEVKPDRCGRCLPDFGGGAICVLRTGLRYGGCSSAACGARTGRIAGEKWRRSNLRHPPGCRSYARPHERFAGRSECAL